MAKKLKVVKPDDIFEGPMTPDELLKENQEITKNLPPTPTSLEWNDYVLSHFSDEEKFEGNPTVDGLRRVAELLIGEIVSCKTMVVQTPDDTNGKRATVVCSVGFACDNCIKVFEGAADSFWGNTDKVYYKYPVANAESRAEGRALRKALKLRKVISAEEISEVAKNEDAVNPDLVNDEKITQNQINYMDILCSNNSRGLNINVQKFVQEKYPTVYNIRDLKHTQALVLIEVLSKFQQDKTTIPSEMVGYDVDWKSSFGKGD